MIHIISGPPCAGKTTYIRENAKAGDLIIDFDAIASAFGAGDHDAGGIIRDVALDARSGAIKTAVNSADATSWIIDTFLSGEYPGDAEITVLDPGKDVCIERAKQDGRPQSTFDGIESWYSDRKGHTVEHKYKEFAMQKSSEDAGEISGYFSTYDRVPDSYGDVIAPGAFTETIQKRKESGHPFPLCWNHDLNQIIGSIDPDNIVDTPKGPLMTASFFNTQPAQEKREIVKSGVVYQFSFAYDVLGWEKPTPEEEKAGIWNILTKLDLFEVSIVPIPANQNAVMTEIKAGRRNSQKDEDAIKQAIALLQGVLDADDPDNGEDKAKANGAPEEPEQSNPTKDRLLEYINNMHTED